MKRILIIDDNLEFLEELEEALRTRGYDVFGLSDETTFVDRIKELKPALLLIDIKMREKTGLQLAMELSGIKETAHIPLFIMTGYYTKNEVKRFMNLGIIKLCLLKPINIDNLIVEIEKNT